MKRFFITALLPLLAIGCTKKNVEVTIPHDIYVECPGSGSSDAMKVMYINVSGETDLSTLDSYIKAGNPDVLMAICPAGYDGNWAKGLGFADAVVSSGSGSEVSIVAGPAFEGKSQGAFYASALVGTTSFVSAFLTETIEGSLADAEALVSGARTDACILGVDAKFPSRADLRYDVNLTGYNFSATDWFSSHALVDCIAGWNTCYQPSGIDGKRTNFLYSTSSRWTDMTPAVIDSQAGFKVYPMFFTLNIYEKE